MVGRYGTMAGLRQDIAVHDVDVRLEAERRAAALHRRRDRGGPAAHAVRRARASSRVLAGLAGQTPQAVVDAVERAVVAAQPGDPRDDIALLAICPTAGVATTDSG